MNKFGGDWTKIKIEILVNYAKAFLSIMKGRKYYKLLYFDGFAGSGFISKDKKKDVEITVGAARRIIEISDPRPFDIYYFVEKDPKNFKLLKQNTKEAFPEKIIHVIREDCNKKIIDLANYLLDPENKNVRTLAYIDPCGMQVEWRSIESLKGLPLDMWILVPTGLGVNRLLTRNGNISDIWIERLEKFLGLSGKEIEKRFYSKKLEQTLFGEESMKTKERGAIKKSAEIYQERLKEIFKFVSEPYELKNSQNSIMYQLFLTSNNKAAVKIGNDIVKKYNN